MPINITNIISTLDKPVSLAPIFLKDSCDNTGKIVMAAKEGGKHEAREKAIEEIGTSGFWIFGIPAARWVMNKAAKISGKINPDIHFKRINTDGIQSYFAEDVFGKEQKDMHLGGGKLSKIKEDLIQKGFELGKSKGAYKKFHVGMTSAAVLTNLIMLCVALPKFNQYLSRKIISNEMNNKLNNVQQPLVNKSEAVPSTVLEQKVQPQKQQSFGKLSDLRDFKKMLNFTQMAETTQMNVASSMLLLDYGISGSRTTFLPRDNNERIEYVVKEGGIILFFYYAADKIKEGLEFVSNKILKTPINLDYKIVADKEFKDSLKTVQDKSELFKFAEESNETSIIKFIDSQLNLANKKGLSAKDKNKVFENFTLKMAQKSGLVDIEYDDSIGKWIRHSQKYIETEEIATLNDGLKNFWKQATHAGDANIDKIIAKTKGVKCASILTNMAICCASLSLAIPKLQYVIREHRTNSKAAPGIKVYEELAAKKQLSV